MLAFRIKVQPNFRISVVLRCSNELDLINVVLDMLLDTEVLFSDVYCYCFSHNDIMYAFAYSKLIYIMQACSEVDTPNFDCNDTSQVESVS